MSCLSWCVNLRKPDKIPSSNVKMSEDFSKSPSVVKALRGSSPHKLHRLPEQQHRREQRSVLQNHQYTSCLLLYRTEQTTLTCPKQVTRSQQFPVSSTACLILEMPVNIAALADFSTNPLKHQPQRHYHDQIWLLQKGHIQKTEIIFSSLEIPEVLLIFSSK